MKRAADSDGVGQLKVAFWLNLVFAGLELIGGLWTNSLAIISDAVHDLGDALSLGLSWYLERYSTKESDARFTYGYRRLSLAGALINTIVLIAGSLVVLSQAIPRLAEPQATRTVGMLIFLSEIERRLRAIEGVDSVHHTHIWSLDGEHHVLTSHLVIDADSSLDDIASVREQLKELTQRMAFEHTTLEIELGSQDRRLEEA